MYIKKGEKRVKSVLTNDAIGKSCGERTVGESSSESCNLGRALL